MSPLFVHKDEVPAQHVDKQKEIFAAQLKEEGKPEASWVKIIEGKVAKWFNEITKQDVAVAGGKGANLGELTRAGLPVPQGFVVTAPAYLDHVRTMGAEDLDATLSKNFKFGEVRNLRIDFSSYNIANRAQFGMPYFTDLTSTGSGQGNPFGEITTTVNTPRQFQFGARFTF